MSTIKEILQNFCYGMNLPAPSAFVGVNSPTEQQYLSFFKRIGDNLRNRSIQWPQLKTSAILNNDSVYTDNDDGTIRRFQLPGDFFRILESAEWDVTNKWPMRGPISDYNMAVREFAVVSLQTRKAFQLVGPVQYLYDSSSYNHYSQGGFSVTPIPETDDQLSLGYLSRNWVWPQPWAAVTPYEQGDLRSGVGYIYRAADTDTSGSIRPNWASGTDSDGNLDWTVHVEAYLVDSSNENLSDNDICLFDDDLMIEGIRWLYLQSKGMDYQQVRADWEQAIKGAAARFNGPTRINMGDEFGNDWDWPIIPPGSWSV